MDETDLALLREEIDSIDMEIVSLLESRLVISDEIGKFKKNNSRDFFDQKRHDQIMEKLSLLKINYPVEDLQAVFNIILKTSLKHQEK
jgi:chorismate mutase